MTDKSEPVLPVALDPRDVAILAEAHELRPRDVIVDAAILERWCWSNDAPVDRRAARVRP